MNVKLKKKKLEISKEVRHKKLQIYEEGKTCECRVSRNEKDA